MARVAEVRLWGRRIGAVAWDESRQIGVFEYESAFRGRGIEPSPLMMPTTGAQQHAFPEIERSTFRGLPGMLADSLPDKFGNQVIDAWLARQGKSIADFSPVDRLLYLGARGMGALEFHPPSSTSEHSAPIDLAELVTAANEILKRRRDFRAYVDPDAPDRHAMDQILQVGVSAGGARAKALIAWNPATQEVRSGQVQAPAGFSHWLLKFDGVAGNRDKESVDDPLGYGRIEYAYYRMAKAASMQMMDCRLLSEGPRRHFMTRRFDRTNDGAKIHMQTLCGLAHLDYNANGAHGYEQALSVCRRLSDQGMTDIDELYRRMVFNVMARNCDDHTKNISFLMNRDGAWRLSPSYDVTFAYNPDGEWTQSHQMTINGKKDRITRDDLLAVARGASMQRRRAVEIIEDVANTVSRWQEYANEAGVDETTARWIERCHVVTPIAGARASAKSQQLSP